ncbi:MAG: ligase-associated DNA damage response endonuclease PdeM [Parasphingorhabdus sp.]
MVPLSFADHSFEIIAPAALFWPARKAILVADLHLEKASFYARQGQMLPPYDSRATLDELADIMAQTDVETVFCLGDNYHDSQGEKRLESEAAIQLQCLTKAVDWIWITGNHDPDVAGQWGGRIVSEWSGDGLTLRHEATKNPILPELSGHYHPKLKVKTRGRYLSRRCFVAGSKNLILPAFGALTGGMAANDPVIEEIVGGPADAVIGLSNKIVRFPLGFAETYKSPRQQPELPLFKDVTGDR